ncbi:CobW-like GTP-binding protein [Nonomuraea sp. NBC_01738]|uniref:zeta toxin family protein n=1 Tax=Nonomuraea sp. NBC_01738 TaxID=2976003 RepID=UPI002E0D4DC7|nr:CobW-like GTP-binding protein [Nonomuraea sp. NBC_01738]
MAVNVRLATIGWMGDRLKGVYAPLYLLAGAPGSGKTTLLPHLLQAADGLVVMDMDELLEDGEVPAFVRVHWALLDCPDDERKRRLRQRNAPQEWIDDALADAAQGREPGTTNRSGSAPESSCSR